MPFVAKMGVFLSANVLLSILLIEMDAFEAFFAFTRAHEDWELDEFVIVMLIATVTAALWIAVESWRLSQDLRKSHVQQLETERELATMRRIEALNTLSAGLAHSGNNLMQPIVSLSRIARLQSDDPDAVQDHLDKIELAAGSAAELFQRVLTLSREETSVSSVDVAALIVKNEGLLRVVVPANVGFAVTVESGAATVAISGASLMDMLIILVKNAVDAVTASNGHVELICRAAHDMPDVTEIVVTDDGPGIPFEEQERIFDLFYSRKTNGRGTGIGLSVAQALVTEVGGEIRVETKKGQGTTFVVRLPKRMVGA